MKTTSYEISKQLKEAGFSAGSIFTWMDDGFDKAIYHNVADALIPNLIAQYESYDLETILEALPKKLTDKEGFNVPVDFEPEIYLLQKHSIISYRSKSNYVFEAYDGYDIEVRQQEGESLADCAARLLIKLHEKGLVTFNQSTKEKYEN